MKHKNILKIFAAGTVLSFIIRLVQLIAFTNGETGFIKDGTISFAFSSVFWAVLVFSAIAVFVPSAFMSRRKPAGNAKLKDFKLLRVATCVMGVFCLISGIPSALSEPSAWGLIGLAASILAGLFFLLEIFKDALGFNTPKILSLMPAIMFIYLAVQGFIATTGISLIVENILSMLCFLIGLLFFSTQGKILAEVNFRTNCSHIFPLGLIFFLIGIVYSLPPILLALIGKGSLIHGGLTINHLTALVASVYALCFTLTLFSKSLLQKTKKKTNVLEVEIPEASTEFYH